MTTCQRPPPGPPPPPGLPLGPPLRPPPGPLAQAPIGWIAWLLFTIRLKSVSCGSKGSADCSAVGSMAEPAYGQLEFELEAESELEAVVGGMNPKTSRSKGRRGLAANGVTGSPL